MPANPENLVVTVLEWELPTAAPTLRPPRTRQASPYPTTTNTSTPNSTTQRESPILALPWYGIGGVPKLQGAQSEVGDTNISSLSVEDEADSALAALNMDTSAFTAGDNTEEEHESKAQKRRARRKRAKDSARKLRRSTRLMVKEEPAFELPEDKAARIQQAKFDFTGASRRLRNALSLSHSYLLSDSYYRSGDDNSLTDIAAAYGASEEDFATISGATASPSVHQ
jgi:hypothetical protein